MMGEPADATAKEDALEIFESADAAVDAIEAGQDDAALELLWDAENIASQGGRVSTAENLRQAIAALEAGEADDAAAAAASVAMATGMAAAMMGAEVDV